MFCAVNSAVNQVNGIHSPINDFNLKGFMKYVSLNPTASMQTKKYHLNFLFESIKIVQKVTRLALYLI